jgi:DNA polymerase-1
MRSRILLQVHDEIILECPAEEAAEASRLVAEVMTGVTDRPIPLAVTCETGDSWGAFH